MHELLRVAVLIATIAGPPAEGEALHFVAAGPAVHAAVVHGLAVHWTAGDGIMQQPGPAADAWLGSDKFRHFWMSYATAAFTFAGVRAAGRDADTALWVAVPVTVAVGIGKEIHDRHSGGVFSVRDLVADGLGLGAAWFLLREVR
jgi:uncharacterized protein YfiM (DUF2279 family)